MNARIPSRRPGFTLIELLIVVAIIAILAAIAVPNFLEARTRAQISRVRADHRTLMTAIESYHVDTGGYPSAESNGTGRWLCWVTTPISYIDSARLEDPFSKGADPTDLENLRAYRYYRYYGFNDQGYCNACGIDGSFLPVYEPAGEARVMGYVLFSHGPDAVRTTDEDGRTFVAAENLFEPARFLNFIYDPTNGTVSDGEIVVSGGESVGRPAAALQMIRSF